MEIRAKLGIWDAHDKRMDTFGASVGEIEYASMDEITIVAYCDADVLLQTLSVCRKVFPEGMKAAILARGSVVIDYITDSMLRAYQHAYRDLAALFLELLLHAWPNRKTRDIRDLLREAKRWKKCYFRVNDLLAQRAL